MNRSKPSARRRRSRRALVAAAVLALAGPAAAPADPAPDVADLAARALSAAADGVQYMDGRLEQLDPAVRAALAPVVATWIEDSRRAALAHGVEAIPPSARRALAGYVPGRILDRVRWCVDCGGALSLHERALGTGLTPAVTLDDVVVFSSRDDALDPKLWAHELKHVMQYDEWGIGGFAARYLRDYEAVEREAAEFRWQFMKRSGLVPEPAVVRDAR